MREKFVPQEDNQLIFRGSAYGPTFGSGSDIYIMDECNKSNNSGAYFPYTYNREGGNKLERNQESYRMFSGATSGNFKV